MRAKSGGLIGTWLVMSLMPCSIVTLRVSFLLEDDHIEAAADTLRRTEAVAAGTGGKPVAHRSFALAARRRGFQNNLAQALAWKRQRNARAVGRFDQPIQVRVELIEHAMSQRGRVEDGMAAVHHVIVERQHHERGIGDDTAEHAGIHRVKIRCFGVDGLAQARERFFSGENVGCFSVGHGD